MKLVFPNKEHAQVPLTPGDTLIGTQEDADVVLDVDGIAPHHAKITVEGEAATISTDDASNITRVNGSLLVVKTQIKGGDALLFGTVQCQVVGSGDEATTLPSGTTPVAPEITPIMDDEDDDSGMTRVRMAVPQFVLRGVSDSSFGKVFPLHSSTVIGRHSECDICLPSDEISRKHAKITLTSKGLVVEDLNSSNGTYINGKRVDRARLHPGDELKIDTARFLVQTPGVETTKKPDPVAAPAAPPPSEESSSGVVKWAVIGTLVIVLVVAGLKFGGII